MLATTLTRRSEDAPDKTTTEKLYLHFTSHS